MKKLLTSFVIIYSLTAFGQTSEEHLQNGILKHNLQDFKGAIKDYEKAIKENNQTKMLTSIVERVNLLLKTLKLQ